MVNTYKLKEVQYFYRGQKLINAEVITGLNYLGHDLEADWYNPKSNRVQHGLFYFKDLTIRT